jgi:peptidoglycan/LPS O-acetylase OafA/YrhL
MRIEQLTFTRFIAAFAIILFHFAKENVFPFNIPILNNLVQKGSIGVSFFFILSGFVMCVAYYDKVRISTKQYFINRFARIYPVFFLATLLFVLEWILIKKGINPFDTVISFLMIQSWIPGKELVLNSPAWSLGVELFFYLQFPFLFAYFLKKYNYKIVSIVVIAFFIVSQILMFYLIEDIALKQFVMYNPIMHFSSFLVGNLGGIYVLKNRTKIRNHDLSLLLLSALLLVFLYFNDYFFVHNGLLAIIIVPLLVLLSLNNGIITKLFNHPSLILLGEISYGFYILQFPIFIPLRNILKSTFNLNDSIIFFICALFLGIVSYLSYKYFENPLRIKIKSLKK